MNPNENLSFLERWYASQPKTIRIGKSGKLFGIIAYRYSERVYITERWSEHVYIKGDGVRGPSFGISQDIFDEQLRPTLKQVGVRTILIRYHSKGGNIIWYTSPIQTWLSESFPHNDEQTLEPQIHLPIKEMLEIK